MAEEEGTRAVKLKIHYTFDTEHKTNHLCRPTQLFHIHTAEFKGTPIGVTDLRSCLDAVIGSSPELTNFNEADYTVYAYDFLEDDTPLVGHGLLSKVLGQNGGEDEDSEPMVTGKVTENVMAKFKKNAEPFLEVKLRLTPIASSFQRARSGSMSSVTEGMQSQWSTFSSIGPATMDRPQSPAEMSRLDNVQRMVAEGGPRRESTLHGCVPWNPASRPSSRPGTPTQNQQYPPPQPGSTHSTHGSHFIQYQSSHQRRGSESGYWTGDEGFEEGPAKKRAKIMKVQRATKDDFNIGQQSSSLRTAAMGASSLRIHQPTPINPAAALQRGVSIEEPVRPPTPVPQARGKKQTGRPRGRPPKTRGMELAEPSSPSKSSLAPPQPSMSNVSSPEETRDRPQPRSVTNTPADIPSSPPVMSHQPTSPGLPSPPQRMQQPAKDDNHDSGYFSAQTDLPQSAEEQHKENDLFRDFPLPEDLNDYDFSQFIHDSLDASATNFDQQAGTEMVEHYYTPVFDEESTYEGPTPQPEPGQTDGAAPSALPEHQKIPTPTLKQSFETVVKPGRGAELQNSKDDKFQRPSLPAQAVNKQLTMADKNGRPIPALLPRPSPAHTPHPVMQRSQSALPPVPASDPGCRQFHRSNTWTPDLSDIIMSDAIVPEEGRPKGRKRVGKEQTKARLETAIANGNMPPFCYNCGVIETPAWRRGYIRMFDNESFPMDSFPTSLDPGGMCYKQVDQMNADGSIKTWKGWKVERSGGSSDFGWEQINLCNPCGLWFHKMKVPRPAEKWQKKEPKEKRKRKRPPKPPKSRTQPRRSAAGQFASDAAESDAQEPASEDSSPADTSMEDGTDENNDAMTVDGENERGSQEPELPPMPKSMSVQLGRRTVMFADVDIRQVKSSPLTRGTAAEPIELDLTPDKPLRRVLFPSPGSNREDARHAAPLTEKGNDQLLPSFIRRSPRLNKMRDVFTVDLSSAPIVSVEGEVGVVGKENVTPRNSMPNDLEDDLFGDIDDSMPPPMTPTPKRRSERLLSKTPQTGRKISREFGADVSGNAQISPKAPKTPGNKTPAKDIIAELFMDTITRSIDPQFMTPNTRGLAVALSDNASPVSRRSRLRTGFTPKVTTPGRQPSLNFDFPDLPPLKTSSPISHEDLGNIFSELPTERLYSELETALNTDAPMPSSPPVHPAHDWDENLASMIDIEQFDAADWAWFEQHEPETAAKLRTPKKQTGTNLLGVETPGRSGLRRSPRRAARDR